MAEKSFNWVRGVTIGCAAVVLIPVLLVSVVGIRTAVPIHAAKRDLRQLEERFGPAASFTPQADRAVPPARLEGFLEVRRKLEAPCAAFQKLLRPIAKIDAMGGDNDPTGAEFLDASEGIAGVAMRITPLVGEYLKTRNAALVESEMGLGEYIYIYAMAYRDQLADPALRRELFSEDSLLGPFAGDVLRSILGDGLESVSAPDPLADSLAPFRNRLDRGYCKGIAGLELERDASRAIKIALY